MIMTMMTMMVVVVVVMMMTMAMMMTMMIITVSCGAGWYLVHHCMLHHGQIDRLIQNPPRDHHHLGFWIACIIFAQLAGIICCGRFSDQARLETVQMRAGGKTIEKQFRFQLGIAAGR